MNEIEQRKEAIRRFNSGESVTSISANLSRSRQWVYKWIKRYKINPDSDWYIEQTRVPHQVTRSYDEDLESRVLAFRKSLDKEKYAQIGALSIQYEFLRHRIDPPPVWTINRILSRHGMVTQGKMTFRKKKSTPNCSWLRIRWTWLVLAT